MSGEPGAVPAIELERVCVSLDGREVLRDINLRLARGRFLGIVGPNGGGKTTLLRVVLGFIPPSAGTARLLGRPPRAVLREGHRVGYLPQGSRSDPAFPASALDVALMGRYGLLGFGRRPGPRDLAAARGALARVGMEDAAGRRFGRLSGGEQQRVSIARALACEPELLVLDEPSTSVDAVAQEDLYHLLKELQRDLGLTIVMVSHDVGVVTTLVDEVACLNRTLSYHGCAAGFSPLAAFAGAYGGTAAILRHGPHCHAPPEPPRG